MSEEEMRNIIYLKNKPILSCKDLHKYFIGRHNEPIIVYLTPKFEIEFENNFGKLECLEKENKKYKETINKAKKWVKNRINHCTIEANSTTTDTMCRITIVGLNNLLDILKEVEHE